MTPPPYLTDDEIAGITKPLRQGAARIKYLRRLGIKVEPKPNGQPLVWRADFDAARLAQPAANDGRAAQTRDWARFRERVQNGARGEKATGRQSARA